MAKPKVEDIARLAGVSTATVGRVLNDRGSVSDRARRKVADAVKELGYRQFPDPVSAALRTSINLLFLLPSRQSAFVQMLRDAIDAAARAADDIEILATVRSVDLTSGATIAETLDAVDPQEFQGVALFTVDEPGARHAIDRAQARGVHVVTLVSDVPDASHYFIGINNVSAGRVAANLLGRFIHSDEGKVAVICGSLGLRDHLDRYYGFQQILERKFLGLEILPVFEGDSEREKNRSYLADLLRTTPELAGVYSIGAGNSGILDALRSVTPERRPKAVLHELTPAVRDALSREEIDAVISQDTDRIAESAVRILRASILERPVNVTRAKIGIDIYLTDNLP